MNVLQMRRVQLDGSMDASEDFRVALYHPLSEKARLQSKLHFETVPKLLFSTLFWLDVVLNK